MRGERGERLVIKRQQTLNRLLGPLTSDKTCAALEPERPAERYKEKEERAKTAGERISQS